MEVERNSENLQFIKYKSEKTNEIDSLTQHLKAKEEELSEVFGQKEGLI